MDGSLVQTAMKDFENYKPEILKKMLQRKEVELAEAEKSPCVGSGGVLTLRIETAAIRKLLRKANNCGDVG